MKIVRTIKYFDLRQIAESGQCFRMTELDAESVERLRRAEADEDGSARRCAAGGGTETKDEKKRGFSAYRIISGSHGLTAVQSGEETAFFCGEEALAYWENYFDLGTDYGRYIAAVDPGDEYLTRAAEFGSGIRILRQDVWEMIITFVISQQKAIPHIKALVEALCERYGTKLAWEDAGAEGFFYAFPTPLQLSRAELPDLLELKLGYRAKYIKRICEDACSGALDLERLRRMDYPTALAYLRGFYGIGEKVANCVCLFGLHQTEAFPVDTWIRKILLREYLPGSGLETGCPKTRLCGRLAERYFARYAGFAGILQQYMFYYERYSGNLL